MPYKEIKKRILLVSVASYHIQLTNGCVQSRVPIFDLHKFSYIPGFLKGFPVFVHLMLLFVDVDSTCCNTRLCMSLQ